MKIVHICLAAPYIDGWGYQENLLPKYLSKENIESVVVASDILPQYLKSKRECVGSYFYDGVKVIRLKSRRFSSNIVWGKGLMGVLERERPDAIFHHNVNFISHVVCARYCKRHRIPMFVDNHADSINCMQNRWLRFILYTCINGFISRLFSGPVLKFYGVTYSRCDFLHDVYGFSKKKIELLPIGADTDLADKIESKQDLRLKYGFASSDFIVISGGKMGMDKGTDNLIRAVECLTESYKNVRLILFGSFSDKETEELAQNKSSIHIEGWCDRNKTLELLKMSDVACWPIHHTTLCEDAVACGVPLILRETGTTKHLISGNGFFVEHGSVDELYDKLNNLILLVGSSVEFSQSISNKKNELSYRSIVKRVINELNNYFARETQ